MSEVWLVFLILFVAAAYMYMYIAKQAVNQSNRNAILGLLGEWRFIY